MPKTKGATILKDVKMPKKTHEKSFLINLNMQNPPRAPFQLWYVRKADDTSHWEYTVAGYEFTMDLRKDSIGVAEGSHPENNFRKAFLPETGHYIISRDFSGQELRILANLSGEPSWIETFNTGGDIHKRTAVSIWGEENFDGTKRNMAKAINFGLAYGIGAQGLSKQIGATVEDTQEYIDTFYETHPFIAKYLQRQVRAAEKDRQLTNHYGRIRRFHRYIDSGGDINPDGQRRAYNFPIQSMGAEITKLGLLKVYNNIINNPKYEGRALWMSTIHDEINLSVEYSLAEEVADVMRESMEHVILPNYPVKIVAGLEIGHSMGIIWAFKQDPTTKVLTPDYDPLSQADLDKQALM